MDLVSELLEEIATTSIALNRAIDDNVKEGTHKSLLFTEVNALDYQVHEIRKHLEELKNH